MSDLKRPGQYKTTDEAAKALLEQDDASQGAPAKEETPKKTSLERWREAIEAAHLTEAEADKILDEVLSKGYYEAPKKLFRGRLSVVFRSRDALSLQRVAEALDAIRTNDPRVHSQTMNRYNLAASLKEYQGKALPFKTGTVVEQNEAFMQRLNFIDGLPATVLIQLYAALDQFDNQVFAAMSEGAELGF